MKKFAMYFQNKLIRKTTNESGIETRLSELMDKMITGDTLWYFDESCGINWQIIREH